MISVVTPGDVVCTVVGWGVDGIVAVTSVDNIVLIAVLASVVDYNNEHLRFFGLRKTPTCVTNHVIIIVIIIMVGLMYCSNIASLLTGNDRPIIREGRVRLTSCQSATFLKASFVTAACT